MKERKTNIHISATVTTVKHAVAYSNVDKKTIDEITTKLSLSIETKSAEVFFKVYHNDILVPSIFPEDNGFSDRFCIRPSIGDSIRIEAYRVPDTFDTASFIGFCEGVIEESGFVTNSKENVTTQESNKVETVRKYR